MTATDIFLIFLIIIVLQSIFRQKFLEFAHRRLIARLKGVGRGA